MAHRASAHASVASEQADKPGISIPRLVVIASFVAALASTGHGVWSARLPAQASAQIATATAGPVVAEPTPLPTDPPAAAAVEMPPADVAEPTPTPEPEAAVLISPVPRVGIVAGHSGSANDPGAVCDDGLAEVDINLDVAQRVAATLATLGYEVDVMEEFDDRLSDYWALALVSIHADSCMPYPDATPPASGFKVARVLDSAVPEVEDRLVACLATCYAARTQMYYHANSVTHDMTLYHNFYEIDARTPAAIIEIGFMASDRVMLTERADVVAQGIVDGIICFLEGETAPQ